jgi:hypothetical protein
VVIVKSCHGRLQEWIDGGATKRRVSVEAEGVHNDVTRRKMYCIQISRVDVCSTDEMGNSIKAISHLAQSCLDPIPFLRKKGWTVRPFTNGKCTFCAVR